MTGRVLLLTCEHGGAQVPSRYRALFQTRAAREALRTHRGSDHGTLALARALQLSLGAPLFESTVTRLLVDLNRSVGHPQLFSEFSKPLDAAERAALLARHYFPHREAVESWIDEQVARRREVVHIGVHSFTPRLAGRVRTADVGLLYDPARAGELRFCRDWQAALRALDATLRARRNYPFLGKADGFVTHLRRAFPPRKYLGIELEVNQARLTAPSPRRRLTRLIADSVAAVLPPAR